MANEQNLRSLATLPPEEHKAISSRGGKASQAKQKKARNMREAARILLEAPLLDDEETTAALQELGLDADQQSAILLASILRARAGDIEAARFARDTSGQSPAHQIELGGIEGQPIEQLNLSELTTEQLQLLLQREEKNTEK